MSNDRSPASNEESTTGLASYLIDERIQSTDKTEKLPQERFLKSVLQKIEGDYHSKSKDKSARVEFLLELFGDMVFENIFLSWLSKRINTRKNCLESLLRSCKNGITNLPLMQLPSEVHKVIYNFWLDSNSSIVSADSRSNRNVIRMSKLSYLLKYKHFEGINDNNIT